jgi:hypothetical protein
LIAWRRSQQLIFAGYSEAEILQLGDLAKLTSEHMDELMQSHDLEAIMETKKFVLNTNKGDDVTLRFQST